jgi:hypothetical protein
LDLLEHSAVQKKDLQVNQKEEEGGKATKRGGGG